jgi:hypothetical protein
MKTSTLFLFFLLSFVGGFAQAPTISAFPVGSASVAPFSGATGTVMTINGTNFTGTTAVSFGGTPASSFTVVSPTQITAVVAGGSTGVVSVTTPAGTATSPGFTYLPLSRIITDFGNDVLLGFIDLVPVMWSSTTASPNTTAPNDSHNLLGFKYNNTFYSTGVNDGILIGNGVSFTAGSYRALPVSGISGTNALSSNVYLAAGTKVDGNNSSPSVSGVSSLTMKNALTDGVRGLNLGTGVTNLPTTAVMSFSIAAINPGKISDNEPDIIITQIADPSSGNDKFEFINAQGVIVGNQVSQDMTVLTSFGNYNLDLFSYPAGARYDTARPSASASAGSGTRGIRIVGFKLSDFGITAANYASIKSLKITPSGNSDYAFNAYNTNAITIAPNISQNDAGTINTICTNGTMVLSVIGAAATGGNLTYLWERSTNGGTTWTTVTNGGNFSGATTTSLSISNPVNNDKYRATIAEAGVASTNTSAVFTLTVYPATVGGSVSGGATVCSGTNSTVLTLGSYTGSVLKWQSSTDNFSTAINDINGTGASLTVTNLLANTKYRAVVQNGSCASVNSAVATITVTPVSVGGFVAGSKTVCTGVNASTLTLSGYTGSIIKWQSSTDDFSSVVTDIANTTTSLTATNLTASTKYRAVVQNGSCVSANSSVATVTVNASIGGVLAGSGSACAGTNSNNLTLSGYTGVVVKWQTSTDNFTNVVTDILSSALTATATDLSTTTQYRAVVQNGLCPAAYSSVATITMNIAGQWIGGAIGDWSAPFNWCGGLPGASSDVTIPSGTTVIVNAATGYANTLSINSGGKVIMTGAGNLIISPDGTFTNNGTFDASGSTTGKVLFLGNGVITGTSTFKNIEASGALDFGPSSTIAGRFTLKAGASVTGHSPTYLCPASTLAYSTGGIFVRGLEWPSVSSGQGFPSNVAIENNTTINFPTVGAGYICNDLTIENGSSLMQNHSGASAPLTVGRNVTIDGALSLGSNTGGDLVLGGSWTRSTAGTFTHHKRSVTFSGNEASVITAPVLVARDVDGAFGGETFYDLVIDKTAEANSVSLASHISVLNELKLASGTLTLANSDVTIVSNELSTAHIASIPATGAPVNYSGTGRFVIQRHLSIGAGSTSRRWRILTAPVNTNGAPTINTAWQQGVSNANRNTPVDPSPGFGTTITKSTTYNAADGYDQGSTNNPSLYYPVNINGTASWSTLPSTKVPITNYEGYMLFARGNRSVVVSTPNINANTTILEPKGKINIGNISKSLVKGFQVIGNPYASAINFSKVTFDNYAMGELTFNNVKPGTREGVGITYYMWDPKTSGSSGVGRWITCSSNGDGSYAVTGNASGLPTDGTIQSGAAIFIASESAGATLTFHESDKLSSASSVGMASRNTGRNEVSYSLATNLLSGTGSAAAISDGVINSYHSSYQNEVDGQDAQKNTSFNSKESLLILRDGKSLAVERRKSLVSASDTIFLNITNMNKAAYQLQFKATNFDQSLIAMLEDKFTATSSPISLTDTTYVPFTIGNDANSGAADRFRIVFRAAGVLPITFRELKANQQNENIAVQWSVENENNTSKYQVEKSTNGRDFVLVNTTKASGTNHALASYSWLDVNGANGDNFYRIKTISLTGSVEYSKIVKVSIGKNKAGIAIYSNPVRDGVIGLQLNNMLAGNYTVLITNNMGQLVSKSTLNHNGGNAAQTITPSALLSAGSYNLEVLGTENKRHVVKIIVQ